MIIATENKLNLQQIDNFLDLTFYKFNSLDELIGIEFVYYKNGCFKNQNTVIENENQFLDFKRIYEELTDLSNKIRNCINNFNVKLFSKAFTKPKTNCYTNNEEYVQELKGKLKFSYGNSRLSTTWFDPYNSCSFGNDIFIFYRDKNIHLYIFDINNYNFVEYTDEEIERFKIICEALSCKPFAIYKE